MNGGILAWHERANAYIRANLKFIFVSPVLFFFFLLLPDVGSRKKKLDRRLPRERPVEYRDRFPDLRPTIYSRK